MRGWWGEAREGLAWREGTARRHPGAKAASESAGSSSSVAERMMARVMGGMDGEYEALMNCHGRQLAGGANRQGAPVWAIGSSEARNVATVLIPLLSEI